MQKTLKQLNSRFLSIHFEELAAARKRADAVDTSQMTLGEGERARLLAATGAESMNEIIQNAVVVKKLKRAALVQIYNLLYYCNRYGVMTCLVPAPFVFGRFNTIEGPSIPFFDDSEILARLGVTRQWLPNGDVLMDYSACVESPAGWMTESKTLKKQEAAA